MGVHDPRAQSGLQLGLVHRFWAILDRILAGFIGLTENFFQALDLGHPVQAKLLEIASQGIHQPALVTVELRESSWILPGLRIVLDDVIYGTVEDHEPRGIRSDKLG